MKITELNHERKFQKIDTEGFNYLKCSELTDEVYTVKGIYFTNGKYGESAVIVTEKCFINVPKHQTEDCRKAYNDDEIVKEINENKIGVKKESYDKDGNTYYKIVWTEIE